jgi:peptidoglycan/xylan/chitin deacetylase (PgdA/CDA1 family)
MTRDLDPDSSVIEPDTAILMYHYVRPADAPCPVGADQVDLETFASHLDDLGRHRTIVDWSDVARALDGGPPLPPDACLLTFDDGHDDHHRYVLPMLADRGLTGVFFVLARDPSEGLTAAHRIHVLLAVMDRLALRDAVLDALAPADRTAFHQAETTRARLPFADPVDDLKWVLQRDLLEAAGPILSDLVEHLVGPEPDVAAALHLDEGQLRELAGAGMTLGGHTHGHRWLDHVPRDQAVEEIGASARQLDRLAPGRGWPFAYPYGAPPRLPDALLAPAGFGAAVVATGRSRSDRWRLGRVDAGSLGPTASRSLAARRGRAA